MAIDHVGIQVSDQARSRLYYTQALAPLGLTYLRDVDGWNGFGAAGVPDFWIGVTDGAPKPTHAAFRAATRAQVRAYHAAALAAGGTSRSEPMLFTKYHADFYAAMVYDPDGHNIEVVCHLPDGE
jgi:catechol 2,3-dioxygenase-like lactoylglutathione lyase family enzyme